MDQGVPVLPRTRVTLTSLTGALEESIFATDRLLWWVGDSVDGDRDAERCGCENSPDSIVRSQNRRAVGNFYFRSVESATLMRGARDPWKWAHSAAPVKERLPDFATPDLSNISRRCGMWNGSTRRRLGITVFCISSAPIRIFGTPSYLPTLTMSPNVPTMSQSI